MRPMHVPSTLKDRQRVSFPLVCGVSATLTASDAQRVRNTRARARLARRASLARPAALAEPIRRVLARRTCAPNRKPTSAPSPLAATRGSAGNAPPALLLRFSLDCQTSDNCPCSQSGCNSPSFQCVSGTCRPRATQAPPATTCSPGDERCTCVSHPETGAKGCAGTELGCNADNICVPKSELPSDDASVSALASLAVAMAALVATL